MDSVDTHSAKISVRDNQKKRGWPKQHHPWSTARGNSVQHYDDGKKRRQKYEGEI